MHYVYSDTEPKDNKAFGGRTTIDPHKSYITHLGNWFYLQFLVVKLESLPERFQVTKEMVICNRKLDYWGKKAEFNPQHPLVTAALTKLKAEWSLTYQPNYYTSQQKDWLRQKGIEILS